MRYSLVFSKYIFYELWILTDMLERENRRFTKTTTPQGLKHQIWPKAMVKYYSNTITQTVWLYMQITKLSAGQKALYEGKK